MIYFKEDVKNVRIFTTGAFLKPMKVKDDKNNDFWVWAVTEFTDDSFKDGNVFNPAEIAKNAEKLMAK